MCYTHTCPPKPWTTSGHPRSDRLRTILIADEPRTIEKLEAVATRRYEIEGMSEHPTIPEPISSEAPRPSLEIGRDTVRRQVATLGQGPGVYRMLSEKGEVLYVGKALNLKRRVTSYTQISRLTTRLQRMVAETRSMEVVTTHTEVEALLLEANLINQFRPRYNILLRDDKSFPYLHLTGSNPAEWPYIVKHRGRRDGPGTYFGPYASAGAVTRSLNALERAFLLRSCSDTIFANRTRPCLKYQLKRCSAPCVGKVDATAYGKLIDGAKDFLSGRSAEVQRRLAKEMDAASEALKFEIAAELRDRIRALTQVQAHQDINLEIAGLAEADIIAAHMAGGQTCIQVFFFRGGRNNGNRAIYPKHDKTATLAEILTAFIGQFYEDKTPPRTVLISHALPEQNLVAEALSVRAGRKVTLNAPSRGDKAKLVRHATDNAREALARRLAEHRSHAQLLGGLAELLDLNETPDRIEVYDNSHIGGAHAIGAMIVAGPEGFVKNAYRKFNIKDLAPIAPLPPVGRPSLGASEAPRAYVGKEASNSKKITPGDDYGMMREVLTRRFSRLAKAMDTQETDDSMSNTISDNMSDNMAKGKPGLVIVDGGAGQLSIAVEVLADLGLDQIPVVGVAKGPDRNAGRERIYLLGRAPIELGPRDPLLYFIQRLRDEAHRFAIGTHRAKRSKAIGQSPLDGITGIGAKRKKALLAHFGSARSVSAAGLKDLAAVNGISDAVARTIYDYFHNIR